MTRERTEHFSKLELSCPCCGVMGMDQEFLGILEAVRKEYGKPMKLNSSFRCREHNEAIKAKSSSSHCLGLAVDISCEGSRQRYDLIRHLLKHVTRIGIGEGFIHADNDLANKSANVMWDYY
jgi:zinc D-Ala-D-Ala carboxypeptidase|tara:strand:+ start:1402 stop:1767 length:366 start_codon:yes stop_codon:yes gene_type:complete